MKSYRNIKQQLLKVLICFLVASSTAFLSAIVGDNKGTWVIGIIFWTGTIVGIISYLRMVRPLKKVILKKTPRRKMPYWLHFFSNKFAMVNDAIWLITLAVLLYMNIVLKFNIIIETICLFLFLASTYGHFITNGRMMYCLVQGKIREGE